MNGCKFIIFRTRGNHVKRITSLLPLILSLSLLISCTSENKDQLRTTEIRRGTVTTTISSTGTIATDGAVEVGTEVSGTVAEVLVDFNDRVERNQVIARLDTELLDAALRDAQANLIKTQAQYDQAEKEWKRNNSLFTKGYLSEKEFLPYTTEKEVARANLTSARAAVDRAATNISKATIRSPIDGMVLERSIEAGQTVAANFSSPTLFVIAGDPTKIRIEALVDETDIGRIRNGQSITFSVSAYPDSLFAGTVVQIRRTPEVTQNIVNYTVVCAAANPDTLLFPGMTATIDFIIDRTEDVLIVPNEAFSFRPPPVGKQGTTNGGGGIPSAPPPGGAMEPTIWTPDTNGHFFPLTVQKILSNESETAISGDAIKEGLRIAIGFSTASSDGKQAARSNNRRSSGNMPPPPMF